MYLKSSVEYLIERFYLPFILSVYKSILDLCTIILLEVILIQQVKGKLSLSRVLFTFRYEDKPSSS